jgi:GH15 family glucan-1,4-alpha-glucosidase
MITDRESPEAKSEQRGSYRPIADYGLIGDCRSAALVSSDGSIDWLCLPRFDSPSIFSALLDERRGGRFRIRPSAPFKVQRRYVSETNVLETTFVTESGTAILRDLMPVSSEEEKNHRLVPDHEILREIEGLAGEVELEILYEPRLDYGYTAPRLRDEGKLGIWSREASAAIVLQADVQLSLVNENHAAVGRYLMEAGKIRHFSLSYTENEPAVLSQLGEAARARVRGSIAWWQQWASTCSYTGPYRDMVIRSLLALKLMAYAPSGAVVAAPTTSLPERIGGSRNWDYRYCWLRDASYTMRALISLGYREEAQSFLGWLMHATRLSRPSLQVLYDVFGESRIRERELTHLEGYARSRPVRAGNGAADQLQLDVYGEVVDAAAELASQGGTIDRETGRLLNDLGKAVCARWKEPDAGIWELRSEPAHHTHSKVLCWAALNRLIEMHEAGYLRADVKRFAATAADIRAEIETNGFDSNTGSFTRVFGSSDVDACLLVLPHFGFVKASDPRMLSTLARIRNELGRGSLLYRYERTIDDGLEPGEGCFGVCGFWAVECEARAGNRTAAAESFEDLLGYSNDLGLFASPRRLTPAVGTSWATFPRRSPTSVSSMPP